MLYHNTIHFDQLFMGDESIILESNTKWEPISVVAQMIFPYKVSRTLLDLQDEPINLDELT